MKDWLKRFGHALDWPSNVSGRGAVSDPFGDWDKDGVPNMNDCQPMNPKKQDKGMPPSMPSQPVSQTGRGFIAQEARLNNPQPSGPFQPNESKQTPNSPPGSTVPGMQSRGDNTSKFPSPDQGGLGFIRQEEQMNRNLQEGRAWNENRNGQITSGIFKQSKNPISLDQGGLGFIRQEEQMNKNIREGRAWNDNGPLRNMISAPGRKESIKVAPSPMVQTPKKVWTREEIESNPKYRNLSEYQKQWMMRGSGAVPY